MASIIGKFAGKRGRPRSPRRAAVALERGEIPWLIAAAAVTALPHAGHLPPWIALFAALALLWRFQLWRTDRALPARRVLTLAVIAGIAGILWEFHTLLGKEPGVALLVMFMAFKPMEMRARRDALVVVMLGYFLLLTHYFYAQSIPVGLWLLFCATLLTAVLIRLYGGAQPILAIFRLSGTLIAQATLFMLVLFLLFPRVQGPLWGLPRDAYAGLTGLSDEMAPGSLNALIQSGEIAFRARFSGPPPEKSELYWRGPVLAEYDGRRWRRAQGLPQAPAVAIAPRGEKHSYVITLEAHNQRWLLALDLPLALPPGAALSATLEARWREPIVNRARFEFTSATGAIASGTEAPAVLAAARQLPPGLNPRSRELASRWRAERQTPQAIANAALELFRNEAFFYTLRPPLLGENAIDEFLFSTRRGFCEHYAAAFVVLMRSAGVPARVVAGYQGGEMNPVDGYLTVRQSDAHAWAEIWIEGQGWRRVDPTAAVAPARIERGIEAALPAGEPLPALIRLDSDWLRALRHRWEAVDNAWNQWVLGYNPQRQRELLSRLGLEKADWQRLTAWLAAASALILGLVSVWTLALSARRRMNPAQRAWRQFCAVLARRGVPREAWEGPLDFARRAVRQLPQHAEAIAEAAQSYAELRYGHGTAERLERLKHCTRCLRQRPARS